MPEVGAVDKYLVKDPIGVDIVRHVDEPKRFKPAGDLASALLVVGCDGG